MEKSIKELGIKEESLKNFIKFNEALVNEFNKINPENVYKFIDNEDVFNDDLMYYLRYFSVDYDKYNKSLKNAEKMNYATDDRRPEEMVINILQNEQFEKVLLIKLGGIAEFNKKSTHNKIEKGSSSEPDFHLIDKDIYIEAQCTQGTSKHIMCKNYKLEYLKKHYGNKAYILQGKITQDGIKYDLINVMEELKDSTYNLSSWKSSNIFKKEANYRDFEDVLKEIQEL